MSNNKFAYFDGQKAYGIFDDTPGLWQYFSTQPTDDNRDVLYARVAAAFRAYNLKANTVGNMPFALVDLKTGEEYDSSANWKNKVKFLPNPSELFRLNTLSYMDSNTIYNLRTSDALGYRTKGLYHAVARTFRHVTDPVTGEFVYDERMAGVRTEKYGPDGKQIDGKGSIVRMWRLDHTTEVIPSPNTEATAIMNAAGVIYHADSWIRHFFERGGVVPMVIAMKGAVGKDKKEDEEKSWSKWYLGLRDRFQRIFRVINADALDVKEVGKGPEQLRDNVVYRQAVENIAMGHGMPLSLLLSNSANYATAREEKATWYENDIIPFCNWMAFGYNDQVFHPMGLHLEFHPETLDPQQEDETERATAFSTYTDALVKCPTYDLFVGMASTLGLELSADLQKAAEAWYKSKEAKPVVVNTQPEEREQEYDEEEKPEEMDEPETKALEYSSMLALKIPDAIRSEIQSRYPFVDAETLNNLHITLVFLGDNRTLDKSSVLRAVVDFGLFQSPIKGRLQGLARFVNGGERDPLVCTFDSPQMPEVYGVLTGMLDNYRVPYHKEHGFIPHMTLAYIPKDAEMPVDTIEPIEINFSQVYYVDGNVWYPVNLTGYENKGAPQKEIVINVDYMQDNDKAKSWTPTLDELEELRVWREVAMRRNKKSESLDFEYEPHYGGLPSEVAEAVKVRLMSATTADEIKAAFDISGFTKAEKFRSYTFNGVTCQATGRRPSSRDDKKYERTVRYQGNERVVHYGDPNMDMQRDDPERRQAFIDRHSCEDKKDPFAPGFWACLDWVRVDEGKTAPSEILALAESLNRLAEATAERK